MFQINVSEMRSSGNAIQGWSNELNRNAYDIEDVKHQISGLSGMSQIISSLNDLQSNVKREALLEDALSETAQMIAKAYSDCEEAIVANMDNGKFGFIVTNPIIANFSLKNTSRETIDRRVLDELMGLFY